MTVATFDTKTYEVKRPLLSEDLAIADCGSAFLQGVSCEGSEPFGFGLEISLSMSHTDFLGLLDIARWLGIELVSFSKCVGEEF